MGFLGSHTVVELVGAGHTVTIVDNLHNSSKKALARVNELTGKPAAVSFVEMDLCDKAAVDRLFAASTAPGGRPFDGVIHFAALKAVGESKAIPLTYFDNNMSSTINLLKAMDAAGCKNLVFSSSCTVYGAGTPPLDESQPTGKPTNAYAATKVMTEMVLMELAACDPTWAICILRYFNPVAAHPSGRLGEDPRGTPNCLMPFALQVLVGRQPRVTVFGTDYATRDGTAIRDYIHVVDIATGHIAALEWMARETAANAAAGKPRGVCDVFNLGTGRGTTVLELLKAVSDAAGRPVEHVLGGRRAGDVEAAFAQPAKAHRVLGWTAKYSLEDMCRDAWQFQQRNPRGYADDPDI